MLRIVLLASLVALTSAYSAPAAAQQIEGAVQLALSTDLVSYTSVTLTEEDSDVDRDTTVTQWGIRDGAMLELGYGVTEMIVVGASLALGGISTKVDVGENDGESNNFMAAIGPKIDFVLTPGATVRPFLGAGIAFVTTTEEIVDGAEATLTGFQLSGRLGAQCFAADGFSISPALAFSYSSGSGDVSVDTESADISMSGIQVALQVGMNGWIL